MENRPKTGVGVIIKKDNKVLLGKRKGVHGKDTWSFPGGHQEFTEEIEDTATRETLEEAGIKIKNIKLGPYTNDVFKSEAKHYITLFVIAEYDSGKERVMEPDRFETWEWFEWNKMPRPLFLPIVNLLNQGFNPFE